MRAFTLEEIKEVAAKSFDKAKELHDEEYRILMNKQDTRMEDLRGVHGKLVGEAKSAERILRMLMKLDFREDADA